MRVCGQHANLLWEVFEPGSLLKCPGKDELLLGHSPGIVGRVKFFVEDFNLQSKVSGFFVMPQWVYSLLLVFSALLILKR